MILEQQSSQRQTQTLRIGARMIESLKIMTLNSAELQERIDVELMSNPALEKIETNNDESLEDIFEKFEDMETISNEYDWDSPLVSFNQQEINTVIKQTALSDNTLHEHLLHQLSIQQLSEEERSLAEIIIFNLDENGFHIQDPYTLTKIKEYDHADRLIALIQTFDPFGVGVGGIPESLRAQAKIYGNAPKYVDEILTNFFEQFEKRKQKEIARALVISEIAVQAATEYIKQLTPFPGRAYSSKKTHYIFPDLQILFKDGTFSISLNEKAFPKLRINKLFLEVKSDDEQQASFINSYTQNAKWFIRYLKNRNQTLLRAAYALLTKQEKFFRLGPTYLAPLTLSDVAKMLKVHETTISRIATRKYIQTDWGIYPLSYLFSNSVSSTGKNNHSQESVKQYIKKILNEHQDAKPLSDQRIVERLKQYDINVARRTVTKYRNNLAILPTYYRK